MGRRLQFQLVLEVLARESRARKVSLVPMDPTVVQLQVVARAWDRLLQMVAAVAEAGTIALVLLVDPVVVVDTRTTQAQQQVHHKETMVVPEAA